jgi:hypothetical protein
VTCYHPGAKRQRATLRLAVFHAKEASGLNDCGRIGTSPRIDALQGRRFRGAIENAVEKETYMLELIIVVLIVLWLLGYFGPARFPRIPQSGNVVHVLLVIIVILILVRLL